MFLFSLSFEYGHNKSIRQLPGFFRYVEIVITKLYIYLRYHSRFFAQVGHETTCASSGNIGFPNGPVFRYRNFFIPRVEKSSKISPRAKNFVLPRAVGPRDARFFPKG